MQNEDSMYEFGASEIVVVAIVALVFIIGILTLRRFFRSKNF
jgi:hypothetical protein